MEGHCTSESGALAAVDKYDSMKKTVFLTGATGNMGWAGFQELLKKKDRFDIRILARPGKVNRRKLQPYMNDPSVAIIWGDLMCYEDVLTGVTGADYVLHVGGMVSPAADYFPEKTLKVNVSSAKHIAKAVLTQDNPDDIKVVYVGSVAQCGDRLFPVHWGRAGDPVYASRYDKYSVSKCEAERAIVDSGIKKWVSVRQSGILYPGILKVVNPTAFHVPVRGMLEWATIEDSGRVLANIVEDWVPEEFWNRFYNISSGEQYRMTNYEFECRMLHALGLPGPEKVFEPQWFATQNFHGMWYTDADVLENYLHFRANVPVEDYFKGMMRRLPWFYNLAFLAPPFAMKKFMKRYAFEKDLGTQWWAENDRDRLVAFYGSEENYRAITSWDKVCPPHYEKNLDKAAAAGEVRVLDHGYDETKSIYDLTIEEVEAAAAFRGGRFIGPAEKLGVKGTVFEWECENGHRFPASLEFVLLGGGWCTICPLDEVFENSTEKNRFISQVLRAQSPE